MIDLKENSLSDQPSQNRPKRGGRRFGKKGPGGPKNRRPEKNFNSVDYNPNENLFDPSAPNSFRRKKTHKKKKTGSNPNNKKNANFSETSHGNVNPDPDLNAKDISSWIVHEDNTFLILNKPDGLTTMGSKGEDSLFARALDYIKANGGTKLFTAHRLDKPTSGIVTFLKDDRDLKLMQELFKKRKVQKEYWAITSSQIQVLFHEDTWALEDRPYLKIVKDNRQNWLEINLPIFGIKTKSRVDFDKGVPAQTWLRVERVSGELALVHLKPKTGRFHQLRVHLSNLGFPIIGDDLYRGEDSDGRLFLHAGHLEFTWPLSKKRFGLDSPLPSSFRQALTRPVAAAVPKGDDDFAHVYDDHDDDNIGNC